MALRCYHTMCIFWVCMRPQFQLHVGGDSGAYDASTSGRTPNRIFLCTRSSFRNLLRYPAIRAAGTIARSFHTPVAERWSFTVAKTPFWPECTGMAVRACAPAQARRL